MHISRVMVELRQPLQTSRALDVIISDLIRIGLKVLISDLSALGPGIPNRRSTTPSALSVMATMRLSG